jgi:hypothetical protein
MITLTRWQLASARGITALFVLASVGAALPSPPLASPSGLKLPASGVVVAQSSQHSISGIQLMAKGVKVKPPKRVK